MIRTNQPRALTVLIILLTALILTACRSSGVVSEELVYGLTLTPSGLDPHLNASSELGIPLSSVYDTLIFRDPETGDFVPGLAQRWHVSEDGCTYTFFLREDVIFHDGTPFNANAVAANLDYITDPEHRSQKAVFMLGPYAGWSIPDANTIVIHLTEPFSPLLDSLSQVYLGMASPLALETWGPAEYQFHQVGTGPYRFIEYIPNDHITLERNPDYAWSPSIYNSHTATVERITFRFFTDSATRAYALETGQVDVLGEIPTTEALRLSQLNEFELFTIRIPGIPFQFIFNTARTPTDDAAIREALIQALDREFIVSTIFMDTSPVAQGPLSANLLAPTASTSFPAYNPDAAMGDLTAAGWERSSQTGVLSRGDIPFTLTIIVPPWGSAPEVAQLMAASWQELGINVEIELVPGFGSLLEAQRSGIYHLIAMNDFGSDSNVITPYYSSDGLYNWSGYSSPDMDQLLSEAVSSPPDGEQRLGIYREIAFLVRNEALIIPIRDYVNLVVANQRVDGLHFSSQGWFPYLIDVRLNS
ncbi:MAG: hypothetical protein JXA97_08910 [Anaerolineales bacterium]|nr:hypothetical protein [Anaerolineales bacterium]